MQKIIIDNFGPIKHADIEIRPLLILIGPQASGKSTIAKLVYFFLSLGDDFFSRYYQSPSIKINHDNDIVVPIRRKFYDVFGSTFHLPNFNISFYYCENRFISLSLADDHRLIATLSEGFFSDQDINELVALKSVLKQINREINNAEEITQKVLLEQKQADYLRSLSDKVNRIFCNEHNDSLYILAGRNATVAYNDSFNELLLSNIRQNLENQGKRAYKAKEQTIDETFMLDFMQRVFKIKQVLNKYGDFDGLIRRANKNVRPQLVTAYSLIQHILKGKYSHDSFGERIEHENGQHVYLKNASSGQQESIRILQDAFICIFSRNNIFRVIEEPEVHLFPEAQKDMVSLLVMLLNSNPKNQLIITTHSPYVLSVVNNLIYAATVGETNSSANEIIPKNFWIEPERVGSYMICGSESENIIDYDISAIKAEKIDGLSKTLSEQFEKLLNLTDEDE